LIFDIALCSLSHLKALESIAAANYPILPAMLKEGSHRLAFRQDRKHILLTNFQFSAIKKEFSLKTNHPRQLN